MSDPRRRWPAHLFAMSAQVAAGAVLGLAYVLLVVLVALPLLALITS
jgi:hypothetical protein